jgi:hypothetical protein
MNGTRAAAFTVICLTAGSIGCGQPPAPSPTIPGLAPPAKRGAGCLPSNNGYLRARIRGALTLDIDWHDAEMECDGGARPDGSGIRVAFAGPLRNDGRRLRMVFGLRTAEGDSGRAVPTNLTVIFEGEQRVFATRCDDRCTTDELSQERVGALGGDSREYRVVARGFCTAPASALGGDERIVINSFDFAGHVVFEGAEHKGTL